MTINRYHILILALYTILVVLTTWYFVKPQPTGATGLSIENEQLIDSLSTTIGVLEYKQAEKDSIIQLYKHDIDSLDTEIETTNIKITKIKKEYEKKIKTIRSYTPTELDKFFTDRYQ